MTDRTAELQRLWRARPRNRFAAGSAVVMVVLLLAVAATSGFAIGGGGERLRNLRRFVTAVVPYPLQGDAPFDVRVAIDWGLRLLRDHGIDAAARTVAIAVLAIVLAQIIATLCTLPAARNLARSEPLTPGVAPSPWWRAAAWRALVSVTRAVLTLLRAIPEYVWAFLFLAMLGANPWPAILALALHNAGILGRLGAEVVENVDPAAPAALRALGASRRQIAAFAVVPQTVPRMLLYFFYRFETCIREATVLGMLGIASLGSLIDDARVARRYDEMVVWVSLGAVLVLVIDALSVWARGAARGR
ncbi:MAG: ABC transporter permease subunit [Planctomycetes bacterium]|nr:ABC transporter permease subunit [Planctomycetota bacterium]